MTVMLAEAQDYVSKESERRNGKVIRHLPKRLKELVTQPYWYIFNVGPKPWPRQMGGNGTKYLQSCPEDAEYSEPHTVPLLHNETVATDMNKMDNVQEEGEIHRNAFLMEGYGCTPQDSLRNWGVGCIDHWPPTAKDLIEPNKALDRKADQLIAEADSFYEKREYQNISDDHRWAAKRRKQPRGWMNASPDSESCENCGSVIVSGIAQCPHCRMILDREKHRRNFPELYQKN
jgi:hypothetical protein